MNKKKLSVVMAGAMLATSVAPVLAAEEVTVTEVQKGTLINELTNKLWDAPVFSKDTRVDSTLVGKSVYGLKIGDATLEYITVDKDGMVKSDLQKALQTKINAATAGTTIKLVNLGYREDKDKNGNTLILSTEKTSTYTADELANTNGTVKTKLDELAKNAPGNYAILIDGHEYKASEGYVINFKIDIDGDGKNDKLVLAAGDSRLDFSKYVNKNDGHSYEIKGTGNIETKFDSFPAEGETNTDIADKVETEYKIVSDGSTLALSDLFDGVMLTEKGQSLLDEAKAVKAVLDMKKVSGKEDYIVKSDAETDLATAISGLKAKDGVYTLKLQIAKATKVAEEIKSSKTWTSVSDDFYNTYYVTASSKAELTKVLKWIDKLSPKVDVLAGANRYETAVKIAKEVDFELDGTSHKNIVLVNGDSLVDGLAAAPLAAKRGNAPILLTESDKLPTATKKYLSELVDSVANKDITVSIVGGKSVVTTAVEKELKAMNLKVERFGGDNREETSMAVAEEVNADLDSAFVVGATGEADAMSIAGYAAQTKTPIIVSSVHGLSEETVYELEGATLNVIGGEKAVSTEEFDALKSVALTVDRVAGANRKATNAAVINKFYNANFADTEAVVVAKDDVLIDALTASNLASVKHAPIVLGTNSLSKEQIDAVAKNAGTTSKDRKVYQVGYGVDKDNVVKLVAQSLGLI